MEYTYNASAFKAVFDEVIVGTYIITVDDAVIVRIFRILLVAACDGFDVTAANAFRFVQGAFGTWLAFLVTATCGGVSLVLGLYELVVFACVSAIRHGVIVRIQALVFFAAAYGEIGGDGFFVIRGANVIAVFYRVAVGIGLGDAAFANAFIGVGGF